jgi:hypothetical protein
MYWRALKGTLDEMSATFPTLLEATTKGTPRIPAFFLTKHRLPRLLRPFSSKLAIMNQKIQNNLDIQPAVHGVVLDALEARPLNTTRSYGHKQVEWQVRRFVDDSCVSIC